MENKQQVILSVDDNDVDGALLQRAFKRAGIPARLFTVTEGPQALTYLSGEGIYRDREMYPLPDLLLLDIRMPKMSGLDILRWLGDRAELKKIPVVFLTASDQPDDIKRAKDLGGKGYLVKPTKFEDLQKLVKKLYSDFIEPKKPAKAAPRVKASKTVSANASDPSHIASLPTANAPSGTLARSEAVSSR